MAVTLDTPISWQNAAGDDAAMLDELQPNILKAHTREFLSMLFLRFGDAGEAKSLLKALTGVSGAALMKSAKTHFEEVKAFKTSGIKGTPYIGVGISALGYAALGIPQSAWPIDSSFRGGMKAASLGDPAFTEWESFYQGDLHAVILIGDQLRGSRNRARTKVQSLLAARPSITVVRDEVGHGLHNRNGEGIEHFGYVDGRSQPLFVVEDIADETLRNDGATNWDPGFGAGRAIVPDPAAPDPTIHFGSYFVYRKLEQNVQRFKKEEKALADRLGLKGADAERAGAMLVGRFEDGSPLATQFGDGAHNPVPNDFTYDSDPDGGKCPFFAHIRKVNPRGTGGFEPVDQERRHLMARRGQTYGVRTDDPNDGQIKNKPKKDVGLLFMAFNVDIAEQFEFAQSTWANNPGFPAVPAGRSSPGLDLVIGQGARPDMDCPLPWGADFNIPTQHKTTRATSQTVTMKGGEYFFMPSLAFLRSL